jgi:ABC-2 type transport system permease protein
MNKISDNQLIRLILAHFAELIREPAVLFWGVVFPILMAWGLGLAFTQKRDVVQKIVIVYENHSVQTDSSRLFDFLTKNATLTNGQYLVKLKSEKLGNVSLIFFENNWVNALTMLKKGTINLIIEEKAGNINYHFDPASTESQKIYHLVTNLINYGIDSYSVNQAEIKPLTVLGTRYIDFLIPGLISMGVMMASTWGISYTIIDRRSKKLLRRMVATPMKKSNFLFALLTARFTLNTIEALLLVLFAWLTFNIQIQGSVGALIVVFIAGNIAFSGLSVLISSHTANPEIGNGLINAIVTPMMVLSGVFFSYHNFPDWSIPFISHLPLTMLADSIRSIFNEGLGFADVYKETIILLATGIVSFVVGMKIFKWY